jgi:flagellar capping protein FliD
MKGSTPNILNYEKALQNRYAEWNQELSDREEAIREKEKELLINE